MRMDCGQVYRCRSFMHEGHLQLSYNILTKLGRLQLRFAEGESAS